MKVLIKKGERSGQVADVQARLRALGFEPDDEPGEFGAGTLAAVRGFQQSRGIIADGIVGPNTWNELVEASWRLGDRSLYLKHPLLRGDDILTLQARLNALGFDAGREDGIFGADTDRAVRAFQREYGVAEDGIFGLVSHAALLGLRVDRPGTAALLREELRLAEHSGIDSSVIVIDPGHGGEDDGGRGPNGSVEADICWDIAQRLAQRVAGMGAKVRFSRTETEGPEPMERAQRANNLNADLFLSIHLNANEETHAEGASTYYFRSSHAGERVAEEIQRGLVRLGFRDCRSHPCSYALLKETRMPAVLIEPCFITNPDEVKRLDDPDFRAEVADAISNAVLRYFERRRESTSGE